MGAFSQTVAGFGFALVSMPILVNIIPPLAAAALGSLLALTTQIVNISHYKKDMQPRSLWRVMLGSIIGIPLGVLLLTYLSERLILIALGLFLVAYALYSLTVTQVPKIERNGWGYLVGFLSGILGGAYNTGGPPLVIYGMGKRWEPRTYKANLQILLMVNSLVAIFVRALNQQYNGVIFQYYAVGLPMIALGTFSGFWLSRYIDSIVFRRIILVMLIIIGIQLIFNL